MMSLKIVACAIVALVVFVDWSTPLPAGDKEALMNGLNLQMVGDEEGAAIERDLLNYLVGRRFVKRLRSQVDVDDLQRKRNYWRQCAFNAVSCFGK
ncbi:PREDICTED: prohormone-1-like [Ceratosolen solmsi marchali]|uniref:Prohormone-1-like n=1 Tax=Ceratosolen solmsi marchali TaxID=326594 RepID=A0AAJ7DY38_9HYME|nr:PREDICTED: prohormone-1-like [Ceratosolen solmsi marchali]